MQTTPAQALELVLAQVAVRAVLPARILDICRAALDGDRSFVPVEWTKGRFRRAEQDPSSAEQRIWTALIGAEP